MNNVNKSQYGISPRPKWIRNFSIIAHIDHGKSTLADRLIEKTHAINPKDMKAQVLDTMDIERERGITIKSQTIRLQHQHEGQEYYLNLIDTPGHVDFSYEVSRALVACEGVLLVIDASQGVQAQTLANFYQAVEHNLEIIPIINKIDLPTANVDMVLQQIEDDLGLDSSVAIAISAKNGIGIDAVLDSIIRHCPSPMDNNQLSITNPAKALIFDAYFDDFRGVVMTVRVFEGQFNVNDEISLFQTKKQFKIEELGIYQITRTPKSRLHAGEVGYIIATIKTLADSKIGDTITTVATPCKKALAGYRDVVPMVFCGLYPVENQQYETLKKAIEKLKLNDASLTYEPESSSALGFGYRCGFLGLLHLEIVQERFRREFKTNVLTTIPSVEYKITYTNQTTKIIRNPVDFPERNFIAKSEEPYVQLNIITPAVYMGNIMELCHDRYGEQKNICFLDKKKVEIEFEIPFSSIIYNFHDQLKSLSRGYASYHYETRGFRPSDLIRLDILVNQQRVDAFSMILNKKEADSKGRLIIEKLKEILPRQMFQVPIQASIGSKIIARENIKAFRKNVTGKCYGGDITRKRKLLEKQKEGKKKMKHFGQVEIPQDAFLGIFKIN